MTDKAAIGLVFDDDLLRETVAAAIVQQIDKQGREALLKSALITLQSQPRGSYGYDRKSPLQDAFDLAVATSARDIVKELLDDDDELKEQVRAAVKEAMAALLQNSDAFKNRIGEAITQALKDAW